MLDRLTEDTVVNDDPRKKSQECLHHAYFSDDVTFNTFVGLHVHVQEEEYESSKATDNYLQTRSGGNDAHYSSQCNSSIRLNDLKQETKLYLSQKPLHG